ncbi:disease resistance protein RPV1 [Trifolium repens]|nr:disease resistance protein RPV1 [Trifolium repens]
MSHPIPNPKYDVFLSFRGEDTRDNFTSHLYAELCRQNIETFIDNRLDRGEEISPALYKAIEGSFIYVVILSEHYASSSWCLDELTEILKCKERYGREVIPVFYEVNPTDVRHQRQSHAEDFVRHQQRSNDKVDAWKDALFQLAGLSGWDSQLTRPESKLVTEIVKDILKKLNHYVSSDYEGMTGIDNHIENIQSLLLLESPTVRIIGIWGMGGIGKTTIANAIFEKLATQFSSRCIIPNVQQEIERVGSKKVKQNYLSQLLGEKIKINESDDSSIVRRLKRTKVLLVFDDVKDFDQLIELIGTHSNFGQGSRIILTSRDKQVFLNANADEIYQVTEMDYQDSLQLFCLFAFKQNRPINETYASLSEKVLDYAKGVPLALKVLGSLLYGRTKTAWESQLQKLEKLPNIDIFGLLKLSYDNLDEDQKDIFLDIACFHRGELEKVVALALDSCGFSAYIGMEVLKDRCLISISKGRIWMHDLIQEMGHEIVRLQCVDDPGKRSRLWKPNDIYDVLCKNKGKGTDAIQGIFLNMEEIRKVQLHSETFKKMHNLTLIKFYNQSLCETPVTFYDFLKSFPDHLKFLCWDEFPQRSLPQDFCPESLVILDMPNSHLEQLWEGNQALPNLQRLNLSYSKKLIVVPDLSFSPNIEEVILSGCISLLQVYSSSFLNNLNWLRLDHCTELKSLNIQSNILSQSSGLVALHGCHNLQTLLISGRTDVVQSYICSDFYFDLDGCRFFDGEIILELNDKGDYEILESKSGTVITSFNEFCWLDISNCKFLTRLPAELFNSKFLTRLSLSGCLKLEELPEIEDTMENLKVLMLNKTALKELPSSLHRLVRLEELSLQSCTRLKTIPSSIGNLSKLLKLNIAYCESLETFPSSIFKLKITELDFQGCSMLRTFPEIPNDIGRLSSLTKLSLQGSSIVNLPESMADLSSLESLNLTGCKLLECVPKLPPNLNQVLAYDCPSIKRMMLNSRSDFEKGSFNFHLTNSQELDTISLSNIVEEARIKINDDAYRSVLFCFPGSAVPTWLPYRYQGHSVTMKKDSLNLCNNNRLIGFALCVVLDHTRTRCNGFQYKFEFISDGETYSSNGCVPDGILDRNSPHRFLNQDHIITWKFKLDLDTVGNKLFHAQNFTFEFPSEGGVKECRACPLYTKETDDMMIDDDDGLEGPSASKECGIYPLYSKQNDDDDDVDDDDDGCIEYDDSKEYPSSNGD